MKYCSQCGISIPNKQKICSMCMGDINHGSDGYYQQWMDEQERKKQEREDSEKEDYERECEQSIRDDY